MRRFFTFQVITITAILLFSIVSGCTSKQHKTEIPHKIISLAPSITETLFALGLGDRVIGVTSYCTFPPQAKTIEKVGGYADANLEKVIALHPDLVIHLQEHEKQRIFLNRFGVRTLRVDNSTCASTCSSFAAIGQCCGVKISSDSLISIFQERMSQSNSEHSASQPKVLFCVGRDNPGAGQIKTIYAAGSSTFYNDLIKAAGGQNAISDSIPVYPRLSPEGIIAIAPDIIVDVAPSMGNFDCNLLVNDWNSLSRIPAVKYKRICCLDKDYATVPGPRMLFLLDDLKNIISGTKDTSTAGRSL